MIHAVASAPTDCTDPRIFSSPAYFKMKIVGINIKKEQKTSVAAQKHKYPIEDFTKEQVHAIVIMKF